MFKKIQAKPERKNIFAIVVTYHPDEGLYERIALIRNQVDKVLIVDNNSSIDCLKMISRISKDLDVDVIKNKSNLGVAEALNQGFRFAEILNKNYSWILTLDQDSSCCSNLISYLSLTFQQCPFKNEIGIIGTNYKEKTTGRILHKKTQENQDWEEVKNLPTSGCLTSFNAFCNVGEFRKDLFIDYVDTEYCMRIRRHGYKVLISSKVGMVHPLGYYRKSKLHNWLRGTPMITNYDPLRHYYWTRNGTRLIYENIWRDIKWSINETYYLFFRRIITVLLFEENKIIKIRSIGLGFWHALSSNLGKKS
tara:strand:+ start:860 stop:1780 length:921 start_codon:yes stop_codon:yes gene_type:complete